MRNIEMCNIKIVLHWKPGYLKRNNMINWGEWTHASAMSRNLQNLLYRTGQLNYMLNKTYHTV